MPIYKKLLQFQKKGIKVTKDGANPAFKRDGKASGYTTLNEVLEKVTEPLNELGIVIIQSSQAGGLNTCLYDTEDDTFVESLIPYVQLSDAQKLGGNITYAARYALMRLLCLEDEDDDGNLASQPQAVNGFQVSSKLQEARSLDELKEIWDGLTPAQQANKDVIRLKDTMKASLTDPKDIPIINLDGEGNPI